jgi:alkylated DNA repair dioxygenase AlkB
VIPGDVFTSASSSGRGGDTVTLAVHEGGAATIRVRSSWRGRGSCVARFACRRAGGDERFGWLRVESMAIEEDGKDRALPMPTAVFPLILEHLARPPTFRDVRDDGHAVWNERWELMIRVHPRYVWPEPDDRGAEDRESARVLCTVLPALERARLERSERGAVGAVPGLSIAAEWIDPGVEEVLLAAIDASPWRDDLARRVQHYGYRYDYRARSVDASMRLGPLPPWGESLAQRILAEGLDDRAPDQIIVNEYQPGQGIARHTDCVPCFGPVVLSLTLGAGCVMDLYPPGGGARVAVPLARRSLLVLQGEARARWGHGIAGRRSDLMNGERVARGRRVSLTFRTVRVTRAVAR